jgi:hypothetical protein
MLHLGLLSKEENLINGYEEHKTHHCWHKLMTLEAKSIRKMEMLIRCKEFLFIHLFIFKIENFKIIIKKLPYTRTQNSINELNSLITEQLQWIHAHYEMSGHMNKYKGELDVMSKA